MGIKYPRIHRVKENDSPPCITCIHCIIEEEHDYTGLRMNVRKCDLTPSDTGVMFAPCSKARKTKFCKYEGDCRVARYFN